MDKKFETVTTRNVLGPDGDILNAMTVDVEDYYHAHALGAYFTRDRWPTLERRVVENTKRILDMLDEYGVKGTFFTLGSVAIEFPDLIRDIVGRGHELASHGLEHYRASDQDHSAFLTDVSEAKAALEDASGVKVSGYRAASFSITPDNWWAFDVLEEAGYTYSSSISPKHHARFGTSVPAQPFFPGAGGVIEYPMSTVSIGGRDMPTGGGFFRLFPYSVFRQSLRAAQVSSAKPVVFYYHPWEIDPRQPKAKVGRKLRFKHYVNLERMERKISRLLADFSWGTMAEVFGPTVSTKHAAGALANGQVAERILDEIDTEKI